MSHMYVLFTGEHGSARDVAFASHKLIVGKSYQVSTVHRAGRAVFYELAGVPNSRYDGSMFEVVVPHTLPTINDALRNPAKRVDVWDIDTMTWQPQPGGSYMVAHPGLGRVRIVDASADDNPAASDPPAHNLRIAKTHGVRPHDILIFPGDRTVRLMWTFAAHGIKQAVDADYVDGLLSKVTHSIFMRVQEGQEIVPYNIQIEYEAPESEDMPMQAKDVDLGRFSHIPGLHKYYANLMMELPMLEGEYLLRVPRIEDHDLIALKPSIRDR